MSNVLILGANGQIAKLAEKQLLAETPHHLTLFLRNASRISASDASRETIVDGSADNADQLKKAALGQDIVYANLAGNNIEDQAKAVVTALDTVGIKRLIWIDLFKREVEPASSHQRLQFDTVGLGKVLRHDNNLIGVTGVRVRHEGLQRDG